jgi:hypothetical protein
MAFRQNYLMTKYRLWFYRHEAPASRGNLNFTSRYTWTRAMG